MDSQSPLHRAWGSCVPLWLCFKQRGVEKLCFLVSFLQSVAVPVELRVPWV